MYTRSGDVVRGEPKLKELRVQTKYGVLEVPVSDVRLVDFGYRDDADTRQRLGQLVDRFGSGELDEETQEELRGQLIRGGRLSLKVLRKKIEEASNNRLETLEDEFEEIFESEDAIPDRRFDTVVAKKFTIRGTILLDRVSVQSNYGELDFSRAEIERIAFSGGGGLAATRRALIVKTWTDPNGEYKTVHAFVKQKSKLRLIEFSGNTAGQLKKALRGHRVLLIPELENAGNSSTVAAESAKFLKRFVRGGGCVVSCGGDGNIKFLKASGLLDCSGRNQDSAVSIKKRHPIVKGVGSNIASANATFPIQASKMKALGTAPGGTVIGYRRLGAGVVVYCGWDYYQSQEAHQRVLVNAMKWAAMAELSIGNP